MPRSFEDCRYRNPLDANGRETAVCNMVSLVTGVTDLRLCLADRDACVACCAESRAGDAINPVVASLVFNAATRILQDGGHAQCDVERARHLQRCVSDQIGVVLDDFPDRSFPPQVITEPANEKETGRTGNGQSLTWAVGLMTAPRAKPTLQKTLRSLSDAGFDHIHVFAEPGSPVPEASRNLSVTIHKQRLGTFLNFYTSLSRLLSENPGADTFAVFQDDIEAARDLRQWCDSQLWPLNAGVVSLFTPRLHAGPEVGWRLVSPGYKRVCGAQALVFRRAELLQFLSDPLILHRLSKRRHNNDAVLAGWVARNGSSIAYHTPSLVQHIGAVSSIYHAGPDRRNVAHAVSHVSQVQGWSRRVAANAKVGLVGWNTPTGLGYQNHDLALQFGVDRWLIPEHPNHESLSKPKRRTRVNSVSGYVDDYDLQRWLRKLDWVLFVERPYLPNLPRVAAHAGVGVACVPNWEWLQPHTDWLGFVDVMLCPTRHTYRQLADWKKRYGFGWDLALVRWPVNADRFQFRLRRQCRRFAFVNGWGGVTPRQIDGSSAGYQRKGFELILQAARLARDLQFVVYSQRQFKGALPDNIELRPAPKSNIDLYREADVCVQPSHFEGLGMPLLECQAAGMPLVTTDASPMNEYEPLRAIPVVGSEVVSIGGGPIPSQLMSPQDVVDTLRPLVNTDIEEASRQAREYVLREHSWDKAAQIISSKLIKR